MFASTLSKVRLRMLIRVSIPLNCFSVMMHCISLEASMRTKLLLCTYNKRVQGGDFGRPILSLGGKLNGKN